MYFPQNNGDSYSGFRLLIIAVISRINKIYLTCSLFQILVTPEVACELTRICLRQHDDDLDDVSVSSSNPDALDTGLSDSVRNL